MSRRGETGLGANYNSHLVDEIKQQYRDGVEQLRDALYVDGRPPLSEELPPHEQLAKLDQMAAAGDPRAMTPDAQKARERLRKRVYRP